jgi:hypothetical protein
MSPRDLWMAGVICCALGIAHDKLVLSLAGIALFIAQIRMTRCNLRRARQLDTAKTTYEHRT